ncbi:MAG: hypothetical protein AB2L09_11290 [Coriobacteriia bacterium]
MSTLDTPSKTDAPDIRPRPYRRWLRWTWALPALLAVHTALWVLAVLLAPVPPVPQQVIGEFISTFVLVVISVNFVLVTRIRWLERAFGGLDKLFASHRVNGIVAASVIILHFLVIPKTPGFALNKGIGLITIVALVAAVYVAIAPRAPWRNTVAIPYHKWKSTHRFMGLVAVGAVAHSLLAHTFVEQSPLLVAYVYGVAAVGLVSWVWRETLFSRFRPPASFTVASAQPLPNRVTEISLAPESPRDRIERAAGQFGCVVFDDGPSREQHPFTISSPPSNPVRFSIRASGDYTALLHDRPPQAGTRAWLEAPYGGFDWRAGKRQQLWLAGGIGITPFLSFLGDVDESVEATLLWSVRDAGDAVYAEEIRSACEGKPRIRFLLHDVETSGFLRISALELSGFPHDWSAFVCGPVPMRNESVRQLRELGMPRRDIHWEEFTLR